MQVTQIIFTMSERYVGTSFSDSSEQKNNQRKSPGEELEQKQAPKVHKKTSVRNVVTSPSSLNSDLAECTGRLKYFGIILYATACNLKLPKTRL